MGLFISRALHECFPFVLPIFAAFSRFHFLWSHPCYISYLRTVADCDHSPLEEVVYCTRGPVLPEVDSQPCATDFARHLATMSPILGIARVTGGVVGPAPCHLRLQSVHEDVHAKSSGRN